MNGWPTWLQEEIELENKRLGIKEEKKDMKILTRALVYAMVVMVTLSCGTSPNSDSSGTQDTARPFACPSGAFISVNRFNSMYVTKSGLIAFEMNKCKSAGIVSCDGGSFTMHIDSKDTEAMDLNECVGLGDFQCEYSTANSVVVIICPKGPTPNPFRSSMAWEHN